MLKQSFLAKYTCGDFTQPCLKINNAAIRLVFQYWVTIYQYLYDRHFKMLTDHKPLLSISGIPTLAAAHLQRWPLHLLAHSFQIGFRGTEEHANADALSRLPLQSTSYNSRPDITARFNVVPPVNPQH